MNLKPYRLVGKPKKANEGGYVITIIRDGEKKTVTRCRHTAGGKTLWRFRSTIYHWNEKLDLLAVFAGADVDGNSQPDANINPATWPEEAGGMGFGDSRAAVKAYKEDVLFDNGDVWEAAGDRMRQEAEQPRRGAEIKEPLPPAPEPEVKPDPVPAPKLELPDAGDTVAKLADDHGPDDRKDTIIGIGGGLLAVVAVVLVVGLVWNFMSDKDLPLAEPPPDDPVAMAEAEPEEAKEEAPADLFKLVTPTVLPVEATGLAGEASAVTQTF